MGTGSIDQGPRASTDLEKIAAEPSQAPTSFSEPGTAGLRVKAEPAEESSGEDKAGVSGMIFPQLEKESPESSAYEAVLVPDAVHFEKTTPSPIPTIRSEQSDDDFFEDADSVDVRSLSSDSNDGLLTDEEYDILDASDEEAA